MLKKYKALTKTVLNQKLIDYLIASGNCAFVTRNVEIFFSCKRSIKVFISGYMIGSPTNSEETKFLNDPRKVLRESS